MIVWISVMNVRWKERINLKGRKEVIEFVDCFYFCRLKEVRVIEFLKMKEEVKII